uniref:Uncharacterized protein n=1 Tax=Meloidogyne incognita TaxID=6306 RepID=A0A914LEQ9_MELIC
MKNYREQNKEKHSQYMSIYYQKNKEKLKEYQRKHYNQKKKNVQSDNNEGTSFVNPQTGDFTNKGKLPIVCEEEGNIFNQVEECNNGEDDQNQIEVEDPNKMGEDDKIDLNKKILPLDLNKEEGNLSNQREVDNDGEENQIEVEDPNKTLGDDINQIDSDKKKFLFDLNKMPEDEELEDH